MATIYVDGKPIEADEDTNLLQACLQAGVDLPYFCWHPALGSVGSCRQCAVTQYRDRDDDTGTLVMACMTPVEEGARISLGDNQSADFRKAVIEWMMTSHPHDCPVCEEGGECHLQDMTVMTGHNYRRHRFAKRTFRNQDLGPFIEHEMNRCITCYRCVRFYNDYAGGTDLTAQSQRNQVYFGRHEDGPLENEFSGNLVEVCPTGVFTDKTLSRRYTRKWDLRSAPSVCHHCSLGCNISPAERYGVLKRVQNRYNGEVNGYFLCDRGRFGYDHVNHERRIRRPFVLHGKQRHEADADDVLERIREAADRGPLIGIGSPRASLESNYALRQLVGDDGFHTGMSAAEKRLLDLAREILQKGPARTPPMSQTEEADAVLVLGEDVTWTAPRLALSLRQSVRNAGFDLAASRQVPAWRDATVRELGRHAQSPLYQVVPWATRLDDVARETLPRLPDDIARLGHAIAHHIDTDAPAPKDVGPADNEAAKRIADSLLKAHRPLVVSGTGCHSEAVLRAAANISRALCRRHETPDTVGLTLALPEANSMGVCLLGGGDIESALERVCEEGGTLIILENDLWRRCNHRLLRRALDSAALVVALDYLDNASVEAAEAVLPAGSFAEADGTLVNNEGRAQRFFQVFEPQEQIRESWRWLAAIGGALGREDMDWQRLDDVIDALSGTHPSLAGIREAAPDADYRFRGLRAARETHRYSGRTAMDADVDVHEPKPPEDQDTPMTFTMEGYRGPGHQHPGLIATTWSPGWNSVQSLNKFQEEIGGPLKGGDPGVRLIEPEASSAYFDDIPAHDRLPDNEYLVMPRFEFFGSEELSAWSAPVRERMPHGFVGVSAGTLDKLKMQEDQYLDLCMGEEEIRLPARVIAGLPDEAVAVPAHLTGILADHMPAAGRLLPQPEEEGGEP